MRAVVSLAVFLAHLSGASGSLSPRLWLQDTFHEGRALVVGGANGLRDVASNAALRTLGSPARREPALSDAYAGRFAVVVGGTVGIGRATAELLARRGAEVLLTSRSEARAKEVAADIRSAVGRSARVRGAGLDTSSLQSVRRFARRLGRRRVHLVVANAGIMATPWALSEDGHELQWATNFLGHFLLARLILPSLAADGRVLLLSSVAHFAGYRRGELHRLAADGRGPQQYNAYAAYKRSKFAAVAAARELQKRARPGQVVVAVHPGLVDTGLALGFFRQYLPGAAVDAVKGLLLRDAETSAYFVAAAIDAAECAAAGRYLVDGRARREDTVLRSRRTAHVAREIWDLASDQVGLPR